MGASKRVVVSGLGSVIFLFLLAQGKRVVVSGSGNVAVYTVEKLLELGAIPLTMSDSKGYVYEPEGFTAESLHAISDHKVTNRKPLTDYQTKTGAAPSCAHLRRAAVPSFPLDLPGPGGINQQSRRLQQSEPWHLFTHSRAVCCSATPPSLQVAQGFHQSVPAGNLTGRRHAMLVSNC